VHALVDDVAVHYSEHGAGVAVLALHGSYSAHQEVEGFLEPLFRDRPGYRRIYIDLPGMGDTPAPDRIRSSNDVLEVVLGFVDAVIGDEAFLVVGHSAGGYLARGVTNRRHHQVAGLALICPLMSGASSDPDPSEHRPVEVVEDLGVEMTPEQEAEFRGYFVIQTPATARRFLDAVAPVLGRFDAESLERIAGNWELDPKPETGPIYDKPTIIVTGRRDAVVGFRAQWRLIDHYQRASYATIGPAGHALPHEQPQILGALLAAWLSEIGAS
jgi:pimeloyl-ACP methyl ester carboxylesterase